MASYWLLYRVLYWLHTDFILASCHYVNFILNSYWLLTVFKLVHTGPILLYWVHTGIKVASYWLHTTILSSYWLHTGFVPASYLGLRNYVDFYIHVTPYPLRGKGGRREIFGPAGGSVTLIG